MSIVHIKENEFDSVINGDLVLVDFYADWCGPCKMMGQVLEELNEDRSFKIVKVNVDENGALARKLGIMSIPTLILYSNGKALSQKLGFMPKEELLEWVESSK